jgi:DNA-directed RNA polymerase specialized sigma24 family protein
MSQEKPKLRDGGFELLLAWLDPDRDQAANECVRLHTMLTRRFNAQGCIEPENLADATLDRVGAILSTGKDISEHNREAYLKRVAYYVQHEYWRVRKPTITVTDDGASLPGDSPSSSFEFGEEENKERFHLCLDECLDELLPEERLFLLEYYSQEKTEKIDARDRMAKGLGISNGALRQRKSKLLARVRRCALRCIAS